MLKRSRDGQFEIALVGAPQFSVDPRTRYGRQMCLLHLPVQGPPRARIFDSCRNRSPPSSKYSQPCTVSRFLSVAQPALLAGRSMHGFTDSGSKRSVSRTLRLVFESPHHVRTLATRSLQNS